MPGIGRSVWDISHGWCSLRPMAAASDRRPPTQIRWKDAPMPASPTPGSNLDPRRPNTPDDPVIDEATIAAAEQVMGVTFTAAERQQMAQTLGAQIAAARASRDQALPNDAPPALRFDPRLPGFVLPDIPAAVTTAATADAPPPPLPDDPDEIAFAPLTLLSRWIAAGLLAPTGLLRIYLDRAERLDPVLHCWATLTPELALEQATRAERLLADGTWLGPLHGIPYGVKDLFDTAGITTGWGAEPWRERLPDSDATIVTRLRDAGAVLMGKTAVGALAYGDIWYGGRTRNPWNTEEGSSGSSAGSASATAAGLCGFAIGTETLGSIVSPSERCGTTGLRPTHGRVPRTGCMALAPSMDKVGPICREVEDTALVLAAINGADPGDAASTDTPFGYPSPRPLADLRIGILPETPAGATRALQGLGLDATPVTLPDLPYRALINILYAEAAAQFEQMTLTDLDDQLTWQADGAWPNMLRKARLLSAVDHIQLDRLRHRVMELMAGLFAEYDVILGPAAGDMLVASNFSGHPCLHLPVEFFDSPPRPIPGEAQQDGPAAPVPRGVSLVGGLYDEATLLTLGKAIETQLALARRPPLS